MSLLSRVAVAALFFTTAISSTVALASNNNGANANANSNSNNNVNANVNSNHNKAQSNSSSLSGSASSARSGGGDASADAGGNDTYVFSPVQPPSIAPGGELSVCYSLSLAIVGGGYCGPHKELLNDVRFQRFLLAGPTNEQVREYIATLDEDAARILGVSGGSSGTTEKSDLAGRDIYGRDTF